MAPGLAGGQEHQRESAREAAGVRFGDGRDRRRERRLLFRDAAAADRRSGRRVDERRRERIGHCRGRMGHRIGDEDERAGGSGGAGLHDQVAHVVVARPLEAELLHGGRGAVADEARHRRIGLLKRALLARMADQALQQRHQRFPGDRPGRHARSAVRIRR